MPSCRSKRQDWRKGLRRPEVQGLVLGSISHKRGITALVDKDDVHCLMIGASGVGKTAYFLYPNLEYACASGMSFLALDTKGDLARNLRRHCGKILRLPCIRGGSAKPYPLRWLQPHDAHQPLHGCGAGHQVALPPVPRRRSTPRSWPRPSCHQWGCRLRPERLFLRCRRGLLTSVVLLLAEFLPPERKQGAAARRVRVQAGAGTAGPSGYGAKPGLPSSWKSCPGHKARWFAGAALNTSDQAMASVMRTVLSRLNAFLDSELEQVLCFDSTMNAGRFASEKSAIFLILPEEDQTKNFMAGLMVRRWRGSCLPWRMKTVGGCRVVLCSSATSWGPCPPLTSCRCSAQGAPRGLTMVPIIQALAQLEKNYEREGQRY